MMVARLLFMPALLLLLQYGSSEQNETTHPTDQHDDESIFYMTVAILGDLDPAKTPLCYSVWNAHASNRANISGRANEARNEILHGDNDDRSDKKKMKSKLNVTTYLTLGLPGDLDPYKLPKYICLANEPWSNGTFAVNEEEANSTNAEVEDLTYLMIELPGFLRDKEIPSSIHIISPQLSDKEEGGNLNGTATSIEENGGGVEEKKCQCLTQLSLGFPGRIDPKQLPLSMKVINPKRL